MTESRFTRSFDGTRIAYRCYGEPSAPAVVLSNGIGCNEVFFRYLIRDLAPRYRVVTWDYRGHTDSAIPADGRQLTIPCCARDLRAVLDAAEIERAVLGGFSMGVQVSLECYEQCPERVSGLLLLCGPAERAIRTFFYVGPLLEQIYPHILAQVRRRPKLAGRLWHLILSGPWVYPSGKLFVFHPRRMKRRDLAPYVKHLAGMDVVTLIQMGLYLGEHTAAHVLPRVKVPALVVAGSKDNFSPPRICRRLADEIPGAEWLLVAGGSHGTLLEFPDVVNPRVLQFLAAHAGEL